jgi:DNA processing protein
MCTRATRLWLNLLAVRGVSADRWLSLSRTIPLEEISEMLSSQGGRCELSRLLKRNIKKPNQRLKVSELRFIEKPFCGAISISDEGYPQLLREIENPPPILFYRGDISILVKPCICIVGSRGAGRRGMVTARYLARELSARGMIIVSGMARGIDTMAHRGALDSIDLLESEDNNRWRSWTLMDVGSAGEGGGSSMGKGGVTCAVLGCGIDVPYPAENAELAVEIARNGCVVSEFLPGTQPLRHHFPRRNRILSGLSMGTVVVEAGEKSGAMNTASWAVEQNREVFAVPGPIEQEGSRGPHRLIRQGACLIESPEHIMAELPPCGKIHQKNISSGVDKKTYRVSDEERKILGSLELTPKHIDDIIEICNISAIKAQSLLLKLELKGMVERCEGGKFALDAGFVYPFPES